MSRLGVRTAAQDQRFGDGARAMARELPVVGASVAYEADACEGSEELDQEWHHVLVIRHEGLGLEESERWADVRGDGVGPWRKRRASIADGPFADILGQMAGELRH